MFGNPIIHGRLKKGILLYYGVDSFSSKNTLSTAKNVSRHVRSRECDYENIRSIVNLMHIIKITTNCNTTATCQIQILEII